MKVARFSSALPTLLALVACGTDDGKVAGNPGSETHWLTACSAQGQCGEGQCVCGVCTRECSSNASCGELGVDAEVECRAPADELGCDSGAAPERVCLLVEAPLDAGPSASEAEPDAGNGTAGTGGTGVVAPGSSGAGGATGNPQPGGLAGTGADAGSAGNGGDAAVAPGGPASYPFPVPAEPPESFCMVGITPVPELCQGAANCPIVMAMAFQGSVRGVEAGLDHKAHAIVTSDTDVCLLSAAPGAPPTASLNPFFLPEDALANAALPIAVNATGSRHVFASAETAAVHFSDQDGVWTSELLTVTDQLDVRVYGATFDEDALEIVYSAHLPDPGSAYNHTLHAGRRNSTGAWETVTLWQGADELQLDAVFFPVGDRDPSAYWYASREEATLHGWRRSAAGASEPMLLEYPWDLSNPVGRLSTGEALFTAIERPSNYPSGPLHLGLERDARLVFDEELSDTEGQPYYSGCPVVPGSFRMGNNSNACDGHAGEACTLVVDTVGPLKWTNTSDGSAWLAYMERHQEWDVRLAERCLEAEIDSGCLCEIDSSMQTVQREHTTTTVARVHADGDEVVVDVRLRLEDTPILWFLDAHESTLVFGFEGSLIVLDSTAL